MKVQTRFGIGVNPFMANMRRKWAALAAALGVLALTSCGGKLPMASETGDVGQAYSDAQAMIIMATERNRYRDVYTDQIWQVEVDQEGTTFQACLMHEILDFMRELRTMNMLADERGLRLTGQEKEKLRDLAAQYYGSLTQEDRAYIGASEEEVYGLYEQYHRANRLVDDLTRGINLEISDSEAKVILVQELVVGSEEAARQLHGQAVMEGTDFLSLARSSSEDGEIERLVGRGERTGEYEDVVFSLEEGKVSEVFLWDGKYYIVKVINDYDEEATQERKEKLALQRKNWAFHQAYDSFAEANPVEISGDIWNVRTLDQGEDSTTTDFFKMYWELMD